MYPEYEDFYLHVGWPGSDGRYPIQVVYSPCGETRQPVWQENSLRLPANQHILDYLAELIAEPQEVERLGKSLYEFLFPVEIEEIFRRCLEDKTRGLRIRLRVDPGELSLLPWEYCYDPRSRQFLALERQTPIVRYIAEEFAAPTMLNMPRPVKLLVVLAAPSDQPALDLEHEEAGIRQALCNVPVELRFLRHATIEKLHDHLLEFEPHILHFSGHGVDSNGSGALALENPQSGATDPLTARQLRGLLNRMGITLAVLTACETARHDTRDALMGVAQALIREEIPAVIAMQFLISETVSLLFTRRFYDFLFRGEPLERIVTETRVGIDINSDHDRISWGIPALFMRARNGFLWKPEPAVQRSVLDSLTTSDLRLGRDVAQFTARTTREIFLKKVYGQWVVEVLARSVPSAERRIEFVLQRVSDDSEIHASSITTVFEEADCGLLILGAPGAGKTIALCELIRDLIHYAVQDAAVPLPVILRLATWRQGQRGGLQAWVDEQLKAQYGLGQTHLDEIKSRGLVLLLDGLDEVRLHDRAACAAEINAFCAHSGWINLAVTCRDEDYADLTAAGYALMIPPRQVIRIMPLDVDRIDTFLKHLDRVGVRTDYLYPLLEHERTPLMTDVILQTYEGRLSEQVQALQVSNIWGQYVDRKFYDEGSRRKAAGDDLPFTPTHTRRWLAWLAHQLDRRTQDRHRFFMEEIQPDWLPLLWRIGSSCLTFGILFLAAYIVTRFVITTGMPIFYGEEEAQNLLADSRLLTVPLASLWIASFIWVISRRSASFTGPIIIGFLTGVVFGSMIYVPYQELPILALIGGGITTLIVIPLVRLLIKILGFSQRQIVCVKRRRWDWKKAGSGLFIGMVFISIISLVSDIARAMFFERMQFWQAFQQSFTLDTIVWWNWGLPGLLSMGLFFLLVFGMSWGDIVLRDEIAQPNQGIKDSGRIGLVVAGGALAAGVVFSIGIGLPCFLGFGTKASTGACTAGEPGSLFSGLGLGAGYGLVLALIFGFIFGGFAWLRHYIVRLMFYLNRRQIPWRLGSFLKYAARMGMLRSVGGGFEFIDQALQEHFSKYEMPEDFR
jgi:hypothetical protein